MKHIVKGMFIVVLVGCANTNEKNHIDTSTLPQKCGEYHVLYGVPEGFVNEDGTIGKPIRLNGKNMGYLDEKYVGQEIVVFAWVQTTGGLSNTHAMGGEISSIYNPKKVLPLRGKDNQLNRDAIDAVCQAFNKR